MPDSTLSRRSAALLRVDPGDPCFVRPMNFTGKLQKNPFFGWAIQLGSEPPAAVICGVDPLENSAFHSKCEFRPW